MPSDSLGSSLLVTSRTDKHKN